MSHLDTILSFANVKDKYKYCEKNNIKKTHQNGYINYTFTNGSQYCVDWECQLIEEESRGWDGKQEKV